MNFVESKAMEKAIDRWFKFIDEYNKETSVPLSYVLLPNPATTGFRTMGSPMAMTKLSKSEWRKVADNNAPVRNLDRGVTASKISEGGQRP